MVSAIVAGLILSGAPQAQYLQYKPKNYSPFAYAKRMSDLLNATDFKVAPDGRVFTWAGDDTIIEVKEAEGFVSITSSNKLAADLNALMTLIDVPLAKCRVVLTVRRLNEDLQTVSADVSQLSEVRIGGGLGVTELRAKPRINGDGTFTLSLQMERDFGAVAPKRSGGFTVRLKSGSKVTFSTEEHNGMVFTKYAIDRNDESDDMYVRGGVTEPGVSFEASVTRLP